MTANKISATQEQCYITIFSHLRSDFHYETYIGISPYRTLAVVELQSMAVIYHM